MAPLAALVALALGVRVARAVISQERLSPTRTLAAVDAQLPLDAAAMQQMARNVRVWQQEAQTEDNPIIKIFQHFFKPHDKTNEAKATGTEDASSKPDHEATQDDLVVGESAVLPGGGQPSRGAGHPEWTQATLPFAEPPAGAERRQAAIPLAEPEYGTLGPNPNQGIVPLAERLLGGEDTNLVTAKSLGYEVMLNKRGYEVIVDEGHERDMEDFVRRLIAERGLRLIHEEDFQAVLRYYNGQCATRPFAALKAELRHATEESKCRRPWLALEGISARRAHGKRAQGMHFLSEVEISGKLGIGATAPINSVGYRRVAHLGQNGEMADYIRRVISLMDLEIASEWGLRNFVPYYSGECGTQSFTMLVDQLRQATKTPVICGGGWVRAKKERHVPDSLGDS